MLNRAAVVDRNFIEFCRQAMRSEAGQPSPAGDAKHGGQPPSAGNTTTSVASDLRLRRTADQHGPAPHGKPPIDPRILRQLFESQIISRHLDLAARELRRENRGFYTIGSSGHEGNAVVGRLTRFSDPAFIHYRSGAFMAERARQVPGIDVVRDTLLGFMAATDDPAAGGRHKVWGRAELCVIPQTSTIASHLPRSVGAALALERCKKLRIPPTVGDFGEIPRDAIIVCSFGDATVNHTVAAGAFNAACYASYQNLPVPILFVCEDNGLGISVHTPAGWIEAAFSRRPGLRYIAADGLDLLDAYAKTRQAVEYVREHRHPVFLHLKVVRLLGHAGTDVETEYHSLEYIEQTEARDPLLASARLLIELGVMTPQEILELYESVRRRVRQTAERLGTPKRLETAAEVMAPLAPYHPDRVLAEARRAAPQAERERAFELPGIPGFPRQMDGPRLPERAPARHMAALINWALHDLMAKYPQMLVFGEDVAAKGGVYHVTAGLYKRFGVGRVFNTPLDETGILGMAIGAGHLGLLPVPEIQYLAYVHNAIDQLRGEACSTQFFSHDRFRNPMVVRIAALAYQKGFGGHFHNDNSIAALRDIPGLVIACPSRGDDAVRMLRTCLALAKVDGRVVAFLEPIALYMTKDLYEPGDGLWQFAYPPPDDVAEPGTARVYEPDAADLTIITFGNGAYMSLRAARTLREQHGLAARIVDLRWLAPLDETAILQHAEATGRVLVVDEGRRSGGISEAIAALLAEKRPQVRYARLVGEDCYIPLGPAANTVLPTEPRIIEAAAALCEQAVWPGGTRK